MAANIDLSDLLEDVVSEVNYPGSDLFPSATDSQWLSQLRNAFWEAVLDGLIVGYVESDGIVSPQSGSTPLSRELQQIIIAYAGIRVLRTKLMDLKTAFRTQAGPVKYEIEQSATVLKALLDETIRRRNTWLARLSDLGYTDSYVIDSVIARSESIDVGDTWWVG